MIPRAYSDRGRDPDPDPINNRSIRTGKKKFVCMYQE